MTTQMFGAPIQRKEDPRLVTGGGRYLDDLGHDALAAAFVRSPHAHARIVDIDVTDALDVDGLVAIYTYEDLTGKVAEPLPLLIPHPTLTHGRTGYALAKDEVNHVGEAVVMVVASDRYIAEDACQRIRVDYEHAAGRRGHRGTRATAPTWCTRTCPTTSRPTWCRRSATSRPPWRPRRTRSPSTCDRAQRLHADGGQGRLRPVGLRGRRAAHLLLHPDLDRRAGGRRRQARPAAGQGRVHRPRRRRRLRREDHAPVARGGPGAVGRTAARRRGQVGRGPPRALHLLRPRARAAAGGDGRLRRRRPPPRPRRAVLARQRRLHAVRHHRPDHHLDPAARALQAGRLPLRVLVALHEHRHRHALPRRRPAAGRVRDGADHGRHRRLPRHRPRRGARAQLHPPRGDALRPRAALPGRAAADLRLRRLPGLARQAQEAGRLGRLRGLPRPRPSSRAARSGSASAATSRAPASAPTRAGTSSSRPPAG